MKKLLSIMLVLFMVSGCSTLTRGPICEYNDTVYFDFDSSDLREDAQVTLTEQLDVLTVDEAPIVIEGHADERGTQAYNYKLGERRANEVREYLVMKGIDRERISTVSYGEDHPAVEGHDEAAWAKNRRAVVNLEDVE